jgi:hypothetical protein
VIVDPNQALRVAELFLTWVLKIHDDIPPEERRKFHERSGRVWDWLWSGIEKDKPQA